MARTKNPRRAALNSWKTRRKNLAAAKKRGRHVGLKAIHDLVRDAGRHGVSPGEMKSIRALKKTLRQVPATKLKAKPPSPPRIPRAQAPPAGTRRRKSIAKALRNSRAVLRATRKASGVRQSQVDMALEGVRFWRDEARRLRRKR